MYISPEAAQKGGTIIDIRTREEYDNMRLTCPHVHLPLEEIDLKSFIPAQRNRLYILCHSGGRAAKLAEILIQNGLFDTRVIEGGITACNACPSMDVAGARALSDPAVHGYAQASFQAFMAKNG